MHRDERETARPGAAIDEELLVLECCEVALDGAGVYDGVFGAPGAVAPWALGGVAPVGPPSGPLAAPCDGEVVVTGGEDPELELSSPPEPPAVVSFSVSLVVSPAESAVSSGAIRPPLDPSTTVESDAGCASATIGTAVAGGLGAVWATCSARGGVARRSRTCWTGVGRSAGTDGS
jgi:hypothetical protein